MKNLAAAFIAVAILAIVLAIGFTWLVPGVWVKESVAIKALETNGFSQVTVERKNVTFVEMRGGGHDDVVRFVCSARNPAGKMVEIYVFAGWPFKGATVRTP